jgi:hypothetical protein
VFVGWQVVIFHGSRFEQQVHERPDRFFRTCIEECSVSLQS